MEAIGTCQDPRDGCACFHSHFQCGYGHNHTAVFFSHLSSALQSGFLAMQVGSHSTAVFKYNVLNSNVIYPETRAVLSFSVL